MRDNLLTYLYENASRDNDIALTYRRKLRRTDWRYARLARTAFQIAREFEKRRIGKGDHIIVWSENCPEWVAAFYGALLRGTIVVPLDEQSTTDFVTRVTDTTRPKLFLFGSRTRSLDPHVDALHLEELCRIAAAHPADVYPAADIHRQDTVELVFTSGTTASPKGVRLTHGNILTNVEAIEAAARKYVKWEFLVHPIRILCLLPLSHVFGQMMGIFIPPLFRAEITLQDRLSPGEILRTIKRERASILATVPRILETLQHWVGSEFRHEHQATLRSREGVAGLLMKWWRFRRIHRRFGLKFWGFVSGGAALSSAAEAFWKDLGFIVVQGYGMTETSALVTLNDPFRSRSGSVGQVLAGQQVRVDDTGEILVRGQNISKSPDDRETADDGWLRTGDVGFLDDSGRLYLKGRKKDVIVTAAGLNVYPDDVEAALVTQPEILQCTVVGLDDEPAAALILKPGASGEQAIDRANRSLAPHQQVRRWISWPQPDFPRTATMKVRKNVVADEIRQSLSHRPESQQTAASPLAELLSRARGKAAGKVTSASRLGQDMDLDSLARVELMSAVEERFGVDLDEQAFTSAETVGDLERLIRLDDATSGKAPAFAFPRWPLRFPVLTFRTVFYYLLILPITRILCRAKVRGRKRIEDLPGPVLLAANHVTEIDAVIIMSALPHRFRSRLAIAMDGERLMGYRHPGAGTNLITRLRLLTQYVLVVSLFNVFPLPRRSGFRRSFEFAGEAMDAGYSILIFPEGEMTKDGDLHAFRSGVGILAEGLEAPVVPVSITGLYEQKAAGRRLYVPPGSVEISVGDPISFDSDQSAASVVWELEQRFEEGF